MISFCTAVYQKVDHKVYQKVYQKDNQKVYQKVAGMNPRFGW
jgi:hypothetical protein